jgi:hypothetical protein
LIGSPVEQDDAVEFRERFQVDAKNSLKLSLTIDVCPQTLFPVASIACYCLNKILAGRLPTVPALVAAEQCSAFDFLPARSPAFRRIETMAIESHSSPDTIVRLVVQEKTDGISLFDLFQSSFKPTLDSITLSDWKSILVQIALTYYVGIQQAGLVYWQSDSMHKIKLCLVDPVAFEFYLAGSRITTPVSRFLVVVTGQSSAVPLGCLGTFEQRFCAGHCFSRISQASRSILLDSTSARELKELLVPFAAPAASDLIDTFALLYDLAEGARRVTRAEHFTDVWSQVKPILLSLVKKLVVAQAQLLDPEAATVF